MADDLYKCVKCGSPMRMMVQAVISAPSNLAHQFSKANLRRADVYLQGVLWETADHICTNEKCGYVLDGYGNYVTRLKKENERLKAQLAHGVSASDPSVPDEQSRS